MWIDKEALAEVDAIIEMMPEESSSKIPIRLRKFLRAKKSTTYVPRLRSDIPLYKQTLKEDTKTICSLIYRNYLCTAAEKEKLENKDKERIARNTKEQVERYDFTNGFPINSIDETISKNSDKEEDLDQLTQYREQGWIKRIFVRILFCIKK